MALSLSRGRMISVSIRTKLTLAFLLVSLVGAGGTGAALIYGSFRAQLEQIAEKKLLLVENRARRLEDDIELIETELTRLSTLAEVDLADGDLEPEKRVLSYARKDSVLFQMQVLLIDDSGTLLWEEPRRGPKLGQQFREQGWFEALKASGGAPVVDDTGDALRIAVPIMRNERFSGTLVGLLDHSRPESLTRGAPLDVSASGSAEVLSQDGAARFELGDAAGLRELRVSEAARHALNGESGKLWATDANGRGWLYAYAPIPTAHWALVVREARDELDEDLTHELLIFLCLLLIGLGLALVTSLWLARLVTRPLLALSQKVHAISAGDLADGEALTGARPVTQTPRDELESFSLAFAQMERAIAQRDREIREASATLEQKVNERTAELRRTQEALLVSNRFAAMGKTAAAIAHELKNALNGLGVSIDLLTQGQLPRDRGDAIRVQVRGEIARLRDISDNLNLFGAAPRLALGATDLHQLLERSLALLSAQILADDVVIVREYQSAGAPLWISCDATKIQTAVLNLCKNALEAMEPASFGDPFDAAPEKRPRRLRVRTSIEKGRVLVQLSDTGAGFSQEARAHLFEPFFTTKRTGTGLGLTIAQRLIEAHGGELSARDEVEGGTSFCLWLPIEPDISRGASSPASPVTGPQLPPQLH